MVPEGLDIVQLRTHMKLRRRINPLGRSPIDALARVLRIPGTLVFPTFSR